VGLLRWIFGPRAAEDNIETYKGNTEYSLDTYEEKRRQAEERAAAERQEQSSRRAEEALRQEEHKQERRARDSEKGA